MTTTEKHKLKLHFNHSNKTAVESCLKEMRETSEVSFTVEASEVDPCDILTNPQAANAQTAILLHFKSSSDCQKFIENRMCRDIFLHWANPDFADKE